MKIKIVSYNMYKGRKGFSNKYIFSQMAQALHSLNPDILMIQEFPGKDPAKFQEALGPEERLKSDLFEYCVYGMNSSYAKGNHGNIILSKYPIVESQNINISEVRFAQRGLLYAKVKIPAVKSEINLLCAHLDLFAKARRKQVNRISEQIQKLSSENEPLVLAGDLNDWNGRLDKVVYEKMHFDSKFEQIPVTRLHKTYPSVFPVLPLDRFYYRGLKSVKITALKGSPWSRLSDHLPLLLGAEL